MKGEDLLGVVTGLMVQRRPIRPPAADLAQLSLEVFVLNFHSEVVSLRHRLHEPKLHSIRGDLLQFFDGIVKNDDANRKPAGQFGDAQDYFKLRRLVHQVRCLQEQGEEVDVYAYLRFSKREHKRRPLLKQLRQLVDKLNAPDQTSIPQYGGDELPPRLVPHFIRDRLCVLRLAFQTYQDCACLPKHIPCLRLMLHDNLENDFKAPVDFSLFFSTEENAPRRWQEAKILVEYQEKNPPASIAVPQSPTCHQTPVLCERIKNSLANSSALRMSLRNGSFTPLRSLSPVYDATKRPQFVCLGDALGNATQREPERLVIKKKGRLVLAVILANALLPLLGTSFLPQPLNRGSILFFYHKHEGSYVDVTQPFLISNPISSPSPGTQSIDHDEQEARADLDRIHPLPNLLSLAVLLCELETGWPIEAQFRPDDYSGEGKPSINATYAAVGRLLTEMENSTFEDYRSAIEACLKCSCIPGSVQDPSQVDFSDERVQQSVYQKVVRPLEKTLYTGFGVKTSQLDTIARDEWVRYWGKSDPYRPPPQSVRTVESTPTVNSIRRAADTPSSVPGPPKTPAEDLSNFQQFELFDVSNITVVHDSESEKWIEGMSECVAKHLPQINQKSLRVKIAILDTGYEASHPCLHDERWRIKDAISFVEDGVPTKDAVGHGTHALGLLLQVAPHADIYVAQIANSRTLSRLDWSGIAIGHAVKKWDVDLISMSFGLRGGVDEVRSIVEKYSSRKTMFAAASNDGGNFGRAYPADENNVICVHSTDGQGNRSKFSPSAQDNRDNFGILGESVMSYWPSGVESWHQEVRRMSGTSVATPIAVGFVATSLAFAREHEQAGDERLVKLMNSPAGITAILKSTTAKEKRDGYENITPWSLFDTKSSSQEVYMTMRKVLKDKFG